MSLTIKYFNVLNTTTGQMAISGRTPSPQQITSQSIIMNDLVYGTPVPGAPSTISSGPLYNVGHIGNTYIQLINAFTTYINDNNNNCVFIPDNIVRITFLGGTPDNTDSLIYGFANSPTDTNITYNVLIAASNTQTVGDYFDIELPDTTYYPNIYIVFYLITGAWNSRTIISGSTCSITSNSTSYCINPTYSLGDIGLSHFIFVNGVNTVIGCMSRISIGCEDDTLATSTDYANFKFSVSSRVLNEDQTNDSFVMVPACFVKGTLITCLIDGVESFVPIEDITIGTLIKTLNNGYKPVLHTMHSYFVNSQHKIYNRIYKMANTNLFVTGGHSIMVDALTEKEQIESNNIFGKIYTIQNKYKLLSCISDKFEPVCDELRYDIYHLCIGDGEDEIIYANNVLTETLTLDYYLANYLYK